MMKWLSFVVLLLVFLYQKSFLSPFFQDDKILLELPLSFYPIPYFPYRPLSQPVFYHFCQSLFGLNPFFFHLILFLFFTGTIIVLFHLARHLLNSDRRAFLAVIFYAFNISLFALFFWVATSYFTIGAFFFFLTLLCYLKKKYLLTAVFYLLALLSNEMALVLPFVFLLVNWYYHHYPKVSWLFLLSFPFLISLRLVIGLPSAANYAFNLNVIPTIRWYLFRVLNLPEGIQRITSLEIYFFLGLFLLGFVLSVRQLKKTNFRFWIFSLVFFFLSALPFFFLPGHMSSYYLTISLFAPALLFAHRLKKSPLTLIMLISYLALAFYGLDFLSQTHWIILKNTGPIGQF